MHLSRHGERGREREREREKERKKWGSLPIFNILLSLSCSLPKQGVVLTALQSLLDCQ